MGLFDLLSDHSKHLREKASNVIPRARLNAMSMVDVLWKDYASAFASVIKNRDDNLFYLTIGAIFVALLQLDSAQGSAADKAAARSIIFHDATVWDRNAIRFIEDCGNFVNQGYARMRSSSIDAQKEQRVLGQCVGLWLFWNITKHNASTPEESSIAYAIGNVIVHNCASCWK